MIAKDIYSQKFLLRDGNANLKNIINYIEKQPIVIRDENKFKVIDDKKLITSYLPLTTKLKHISKPVSYIGLKDSILKIAKLLVENDVDYIPVVQNGGLKGVVEEKHVLKAILNMTNESIGKIASNAICINIEDPVGKALSIMKEYHVYRIPVLSKGKLVGIVTKKDILEKIFIPKIRETRGEKIGEKKKLTSLLIRNFMKENVVTIKPTESMKNAIIKMLSNDISCLIVNNGKIRIVTIKDILEFIAFREVNKINIQIAGDREFLDEEDVRIIKNDVKRVIKKFPFLKSGYLILHLKAYKNQYKGKRLWNVRIRLSTEKHFFVAHSEGYGVLYVVQHTLNKLEREILKYKETYLHV